MIVYLSVHVHICTVYTLIYVQQILAAEMALPLVKNMLEGILADGDQAIDIKALLLEDLTLLTSDLPSTEGKSDKKTPRKSTYLSILYTL
jgi:hypothetical protein